jgi:hypothetical protein
MKSKPAPTPKTRKSASGPNQRLRNDLLLGLEHLRQESREIARLYAANLQRDMAQLIETVGAAAESRSGRATQSLARIKKVLDDLEVKPEKGRRKDLRRIEQAVRAMTKHAAS